MEKLDGAQPVYILQLASHRRFSVIIELNNNFNTIPAELQVYFSLFAQPIMTFNLMAFLFFHSQELLEDARILKVGIRPAGDINGKCRVVGTLNLHWLLFAYKKKPISMSLPKLCKWLLKVQLNTNPSPKLQRTKKYLIKNAAHMSIELFKEFVKRLEPKTDDADQEISLEEFIKKHCQDYLDVIFVGRELKLAKSNEPPSEK